MQRTWERAKMATTLDQVGKTRASSDFILVLGLWFFGLEKYNILWAYPKEEVLAQHEWDLKSMLLSIGWIWFYLGIVLNSIQQAFVTIIWCFGSTSPGCICLKSYPLLILKQPRPYHFNTCFTFSLFFLWIPYFFSLHRLGSL